MVVHPAVWDLGETDPQIMQIWVRALAWPGGPAAQWGEEHIPAWVCGHRLLVQAEGKVGIAQERGGGWLALWCCMIVPGMCTLAIGRRTQPGLQQPERQSGVCHPRQT